MLDARGRRASQNRRLVNGVWSVALLVTSALAGCLSPASPTLWFSRQPPTAMNARFSAETPSQWSPYQPRWRDEPTVLPEATGGVWEWATDASQPTAAGVGLPRRVSIDREMVAVAAGRDFGLALDAQGTVWSWGHPRSPQTARVLGSYPSVPTQVEGLPQVLAIATGELHQLALGIDGRVWSWGYNGSGQLGNGTQYSHFTPRLVVELDELVAIAAGRNHSLALRSDGTVWAWGAESSLRDGSFHLTPRLLPHPVPRLPEIVAIAAGGACRLALSADGTVWEWGSELENAGDLLITDGWEGSLPVMVSGLPEVAAIFAGEHHRLAVTVHGALYTWGENQAGQLGHGTVGQRAEVPARVDGLPPVQVATGGAELSAALSRDGQVYAWGRGTPPIAVGLTREAGDRLRPRLVEALHHIQQVSASGNSLLALQGEHRPRLATPHFSR